MDERARIMSLTRRAAEHGVDLQPVGAPLAIIEVVERLVNRLDAYRDKPGAKSKLIIE